MPPRGPRAHWSATSHALLRKCKRAWYNTYVEGLAEPSSEALAVGSAGHKGMEALLLGADVEDAVDATLQKWRASEVRPDISPPELFHLEHEVLLGNLIRGWARTHHEEFLEEYEPLNVETKQTVDLGGEVPFLYIPDVVVRHRASGVAYAVDWKFISNLQGWGSKYEVDMQAWLYSSAIAAALPGEFVGGVVFVGLNRGGRYKGRYSSPLICGWREPDTGRMVSKYRQGWAKTYAWEAEMLPAEDRVRLFLEWVPERIVRAQYEVSPPIAVPQGFREEFLRECLEIEAAAPKPGVPALREWGNSCKYCGFLPNCLEQHSLEELQLMGALEPRREER